MTTDSPESRPMSRRKFLGIATVLGTIVASKPVLDFVFPSSEIKINTDVINKEKGDDLGLGELGKRRSEYFATWPRSRAWVVVNNVLAAEKLDGKEFKTGQEYSLIDLLDLRASYKNNIDPAKGYITGFPVKTSFPFISAVESHGISLTATSFARALAAAPVAINEWNTHANIDDLMKSYFDPKLQFQTNPIFGRYGTDATIYSDDNYSFDLRFTPQMDLILRYKVTNSDGQPLTVPNMLETLKGYTQTTYAKVTEPINIRIALGTKEDSGHKVILSPTVTDEYEGRKRPGFVRELSMNGETKIREKFQALYDTNGTYMP